MVDSSLANKFDERYAILYVMNYLSDYGIVVDKEDVFIVWSCKTVQNRKYILGNRVTDDIFELTLNGDDREVYIDVYRKVNKITERL
jgi:hypothetical protein